MPAETAAQRFAEIRGVGRGAVEVVREGELGALVSEVPLAEFDDEPLAQNLHDPRWLEAGARGHDAVLSAAARGGTVVPFRFGTIYRSADQVRAMLVQNPHLPAALESVRGRVELGVKGFVDDIRPADEAGGGGDQELSPGRRYLERKQEARRSAEALDALIARAAEATHERLGGLADDARANPLQPPELSPPGAVMFLNAAYLVRASEEAAFRTAVGELETELDGGASFEVTGPWPAYNFVEVEA